MNLRQLVTGVASGYVTKVIQFAASISLIPFLLRDEVLGLSGYGTVFTIFALTGFLPLLVDGLRFSYIRELSRATDPGSSADETPMGVVLWSGTKVLAVSCTTLAGAMTLLGPAILPMSGIEPSTDALVALGLASTMFWVENVLQLFRVPFLARGSISFVNFVGAAEVLLRTLTYFLFFSVFSASLAAYFAIQLGFTLLRSLTFAACLRWRSPDDLRGFSRAPWRGHSGSLRYSLPIMGYFSMNHLVCRAPIIVANRVLGAEESGLLALVIETMRRYAMQLLYSVLQPIALPIASRLDPRRLSDSSRSVLWNLERLYVFATGVTVVAASASMHFLIELWLGSNYLAIALPAQLFLIGSGVEIAFSLRQSLLMGQGMLGRSMPMILGAGVLSLVATISAALLEASWLGMVASVTIYLVVANGLGIGQAFSLAFRKAIPVPGPWRATSFLVLSGAVAVASTRWLGGPELADTGIALFITLVLTLGMGHLILIRLPVAVDTVRTLVGSMDRNILTSQTDRENVEAS